MRIKIEFEKGGEFIADMDEKKAPKTAQSSRNDFPLNISSITAQLRGKQLWHYHPTYQCPRKTSAPWRSTPVQSASW